MCTENELAGLGMVGLSVVWLKHENTFCMLKDKKDRQFSMSHDK